MNHYSQTELDAKLDAKIYTFMERKMREYPELADERFYIERERAAAPDRVSRGQLFSFLRTNEQY